MLDRYVIFMFLLTFGIPSRQRLICKHLNALIAGESVMTPVYNMKTGYRDGDGHKFDALPPNGTPSWCVPNVYLAICAYSVHI